MAQGLPATGCENYGGPLATAGGLVVIAATVCERRLRRDASAHANVIGSGRSHFFKMVVTATALDGALLLPGKDSIAVIAT